MTLNGVTVIPPVPLSALPPFGATEIRKRTQAIQEVMRSVMKEGTHYGVIPGTPKPSLWKAGAEVIAMTFRLAPMLDSRVVADDHEAEWSFTSTRRDGTLVQGVCVGFFEVEAVCTIVASGGEHLSRCSARCNNREAKYRGLLLYDLRNTIQKIAEKRAFVSALLMATGASDLFTQDLEDLPAEPSPATATKEQPSRGRLLSPKREAWLRQVGLEAHIPSQAMDRCIQHLQAAGDPEVKAFFDDMARRKGEVFKRFLVE